MKKFELIDEFKIVFDKKLFRIRALVSFGNVESGDLGGYVEKEENLSHDGNARVHGDARVRGDADYACVKGFGSEYRTTTFFRTKDGDIGVRCGCFYGMLDAFREKVKETHGDTKYAKEYLMIADLMKMHFDGGGQP